MEDSPETDDLYLARVDVPRLEISDERIDQPVFPIFSQKNDSRCTENKSLIEARYSSNLIAPVHAP